MSTHVDNRSSKERGWEVTDAHVAPLAWLAIGLTIAVVISFVLCDILMDKLQDRREAAHGEAHPMTHDLCVTHADRSTAPSGWELRDDRPPRGIYALHAS